MKKLVFSFLPVMVLLSSCGEYPCTRASAQFALIGFPGNETDTVIVRKFSKSANFTSLIDSFFLDFHNSSYYLTNDTLEISSGYGSDGGLTSDFDYEILLPKAGRTFKLTNITEEYRSIRQGLSMDKVGCLNYIKSYELDGRPVTGLFNYYILYIKK